MSKLKHQKPSDVDHAELQAVIAKQLRYQRRKTLRGEVRARQMATPPPDRNAREAQKRRKASA